MRISASALVLGLVLSFECPALEIVHLKNGFTLEADSHTESDGMAVLQMGNGTITVGQNEIGSIEHVASAAASSTLTGKEATPDPEKLLADAAAAYGVDAAFVHSVAQIESGLQQKAISPKGAIGLMQLMPATAADLHVDPRQADANASGGARYLRELLLRYQGDSVRALAAYNAGPGAVEKYKGAPPYEETRRYIKRVLQEYKDQLKAQAAAKPPARSRSAAANRPSATD